MSFVFPKANGRKDKRKRQVTSKRVVYYDWADQASESVHTDVRLKQRLLVGNQKPRYHQTQFLCVRSSFPDLFTIQISPNPDFNFMKDVAHGSPLRDQDMSKCHSSFNFCSKLSKFLTVHTEFNWNQRFRWRRLIFRIRKKKKRIVSSVNDKFAFPETAPLGSAVKHSVKTGEDEELL